jgi:amino acid transporter
MAEANSRDQTGVFDAAFLGVGAMVGAGIFALLGDAGAIAGSAVWVSFLIAVAITTLQGYSFAKLGQETESTASPDLAPTPDV